MQDTIISTHATPVLPGTLADAFIARAHRLQVSKGQAVLSEGAESADVFYIIDGMVQISLFSTQGRETVLRRLASGQIFGELAALDAMPRSATVLAVTDTILARISAAQFGDFMRDVPDAGHWVARLLAGYLRSLTSKTQELATMPMPCRLMSELLRMAEAQQDGDRAEVTMLPTHVEMAARIGSQRERVSREFSSLLRAGLVQREGRRLIVPSMSALRRALSHALG